MHQGTGNTLNFKDDFLRQGKTEICTNVDKINMKNISKEAEQ